MCGRSTGSLAIMQERGEVNRPRRARAISPRQEHYIAMALVIAAVGFFLVLATQITAAWALGAFMSFAAYAVWNLAFACPVCGTPYLYKTIGTFFVAPTTFPVKCRKCGHDTRSKQA